MTRTYQKNRGLRFMSRLQPTYKPAKPIVSVLCTTKRVPVMSSQQIKNHVTCSTVYKREEINLTVRACSLTCSPAWNVCLSHLWKYWMQEDIRSGDNNSKRNPDYEHFNSFRLVSFSHSIQFWKFPFFPRWSMSRSRSLQFMLNDFYLE